MLRLPLYTYFPGKPLTRRLRETLVTLPPRQHLRSGWIKSQQLLLWIFEIDLFPKCLNPQKYQRVDDTSHAPFWKYFTHVKSAEKGWGFDAPFCPATISPQLHRRTEGRILAIHPACPPGQGRRGDHSRSSLREFHIFEYVHFWENKVVTTWQQEGLCGRSERDVCLN